MSALSLSMRQALRSSRARVLSSRFLSSSANTYTPQNVSAEQAERALKRNEEIRQQHFAQKSEFPEHSQGDHQIQADEANRKRIIYRSKQRGWLEVDLLLGSWASQNVMTLTADELKQYEDILNQETIDIFNYVSGKDAIPEALNTPVMKRLQEYAFSHPLGKASVEGFEANKKYMSN